MLSAAAVAAALSAAVLAVLIYRRAVRHRTPAPPPRDPAAVPSGTSAAGTVPAFRAILRVAVAAVLLVALVALVVNYEHARDVAARNGEQWRQWLYPLASDGLILSASLVMLVRRLLQLPAGALAWTAFAAGIVASAATNIAHAVHQGGDAAQLTERIVVSAWPTVALLVAHEMLMQIVAHFAGERVRQAAEPLAAQHTATPTAAAHRSVDAVEALAEGAEPVPEPVPEAPAQPTGTGRQPTQAGADLAAAARLRDAARAEIRRARADGYRYTGKEIAARYGMSERWGRNQLRDAEQDTDHPGEPAAEKLPVAMSTELTEATR